ncbi:sodium:calcium antiporter [Pseudonocardia alni]|uniref:Cation:H+ antiporter n=1 Tax=Pseudonocardia alni TaxID=33907 RepID=A0AA44ZS73_PSEA5|nr:MULTISPECIES: sodium:proton exchanger [Pseudonocardia]MYW74434.1 sodium:proton exchanger [Pseudonocardia sp. SID8383]OJG05038.1 putative calcium/sodium:proton antiporter [Pseudonocardia autotrophica]PKB33833.1 cation:H+ antiporter [Pseudonocardia alni]
MIPVIEFVLGVAVLVYSAEKLIGYLVGVASRWAISLFLIAVVFTGIEFDDLAFGVVLNMEDLSDVALGAVIGTTIALTGVVLALAAIIAPTRVEVPRDYLALYVAAPVVMFLLALGGLLTAGTGVVLILLFVAFVGWIAYREYSARRPVWRNAEVYEQLEKAGVGAGGTATASAGSGGPGGPPRADAATGPPGFRLPEDLRVDDGFLAARAQPPGRTILFAVIALIGLVVGALIAGQGTEGILETWAISGTVFGVTIATLALSLEDLLITVEPARRGAPEIAVANVLGSVVFSVTGKLGVILLVGGAIVVDPTALVWHLPVLLALTVLSAVFLGTGRIRRWHGVVLLALYIAYFVISLTVFGGVPVDD